MQVVALITFALCVLALLYTATADKKKGDINNYHKRVGAKYMEEAAQIPGAIKLKSGMVIEILKSSDKADARSPYASDSCRVTYKGTFKDGKQFDAGTTSFAPNQVIKGWTEAMQLMGEGDKWKLHIPYDLAYGERGAPPRIPGFTPLIFEIEIHEVNGSKGKPIAEARTMLAEATAKGDEL